MAHFEKVSRLTNLVQGRPYSPWQLLEIVLWILLIVQMIMFPILGAMIGRRLCGTASHDRRIVSPSPGCPDAVQLSAFSRYYRPSWFHWSILAKAGITPKETVIAVHELSLNARKGQIMVLGANGSGKSTTLDAIAGLISITSGSIKVDGIGGLGLYSQKNVL